MGYTKIVQFGDITEVYQYEKPINKKPKDALQITKLISKDRRNSKESVLQSTTKNRTRKIRELAKRTGTYERSHASITRSRTNFIRLCHHNNILAQSIYFLTLTFAVDVTYKQGTRYVARFFEKVKKNTGEVSASYISVPELTKKGRYHFHLLLYNISTKVAGKKYSDEEYTSERETRNLQRCFERGYVDILPTTYTSEGIAGYMGKYMAKALRDAKSQSERGYNSSRNIKKITSTGSNTLDQYLDMIVDTTDLEKTKHREYNVPYLGKCLYTKLINPNQCQPLEDQ